MHANILMALTLSFLATSFSQAELPLTGGKTTTRQEGPTAFSQSAANLALTDKIDFSVGNSFFRNPWVIAPSSTTARDGLGPLFNTNGCQNCHIRDGRGHAPLNKNDSAVSMLIRLSIKAISDEQIAMQQKFGPLNEPTYGHQLQDHAIPGLPAEGRISVTWKKQPFTYPDGSKVMLRKPVFRIKDWGYGPPHQHIQTSARIAPSMIGLGLLEQIEPNDILAQEDPLDLDNNGISGKANWVWDVEKEQSRLGRFGWKAGQPTLLQQNAAAFNGDIGITSRLFPNDDCSSKQPRCQKQPNGNSHDQFEAQENVLAAVTFYSQHLAVPIQRNHEDPDVQQGLQLFDSIGCQQCHTRTFTTAKNSALPALSEQVIHPFTDLLLHDMGQDLADNREEFLANGQEWRTAPLWGLGYLQEVNGQVALLHDGRAQTIEEAILWHGGEAEQSKQNFTQLKKSERDALLSFLKSL